MFCVKHQCCHGDLVATASVWGGGPDSVASRSGSGSSCPTCQCCCPTHPIVCWTRVSCVSFFSVAVEVWARSSCCGWMWEFFIALERDNTPLAARVQHVEPSQPSPARLPLSYQVPHTCYVPGAGSGVRRGRVLSFQGLHPDNIYCSFSGSSSYHGLLDVISLLFVFPGQPLPHQFLCFLYFLSLLYCKYIPACCGFLINVEWMKEWMNMILEGSFQRFIENPLWLALERWYSG